MRLKGKLKSGRRKSKVSNG